MDESICFEGCVALNAAVLWAVHVQLAFPFQGNVDPRLGWMKVKMRRPEAVSAIGRDGSLVGQEAVVVVEHLKRAWLLRLIWTGADAAGDEDRMPIVRSDAYLVSKDRPEKYRSGTPDELRVQ